MSHYNVRQRDTKWGAMATVSDGGAEPVAEVMVFNAEGRDHIHPVWETAICIGGRGWIIIDGRGEAVESGDVVTIPPETPHHMKPLREAPFEFILWYSDEQPSPFTHSAPVAS